MPIDYADSWDQGQRCYFSFSINGVSGYDKDEIQSDAFHKYPEKNPGGYSDDKYNNEINVFNSITISVNWNQYTEPRKKNTDKLIYHPIELKSNQVIRILAYGTKTNYDFIAISKNVIQPDTGNEKCLGSLTFEPIYFYKFNYEKNDQIKKWSIICNENKISNYEINNKSCSVEAFGLTNSAVGNANLNITIGEKQENQNDNEDNSPKEETIGTSTRTIITSYNGEPGINSNDSSEIKGLVYPTIINLFDNYETKGLFEIQYFGDINYKPWKDITVSGDFEMNKNKSITNNKIKQNSSEDNDNQTVEWPGYDLNEDLFIPGGSTVTTSYSSSSASIIEEGDSEITETKQTYSTNYTFLENSLEIYKKTDSENELNKFAVSAVINNSEKISRENLSFESFSSKTINSNYGAIGYPEGFFGEPVAITVNDYYSEINNSNSSNQGIIQIIKENESIGKIIKVELTPNSFIK